MTFLRNTWYPAVLSTQVHADRPVSRTIADEGLVFYRGRDGQPVALRDRCPHRFAPLSKGRIVDGTVTCIYHGLQFDGTGACVHNPHGDGKIPAKALVRSYPVVDRHGFIWVWIGDAELADARAIADLSPFDRNPPSATYWGQVPLPMNYLLMQDNLMDFSHVDHLHTAFGTGGLSAAKPSVREVDGTVVVSWAWTADAPFLFLAPFMAEGSVDSWLQVTWHAPAIIVVESGSTPVGRPREEGCSNFGVHALCPATDTSVYHGYALTRSYAQDNLTLTAETDKALKHVNETEDQPIILAAQEEMGTTDLFSLSPVLLQNDGGVMMARRLLSKMIRREQELATAA